MEMRNFIKADGTSVIQYRDPGPSKQWMDVQDVREITDATGFEVKTRPFLGVAIQWNGTNHLSIIKVLPDVNVNLLNEIDNNGYSLEVCWRENKDDMTICSKVRIGEYIVACKIFGLVRRYRLDVVDEKTLLTLFDRVVYPD